MIDMSKGKEVLPSIIRVLPSIAQVLSIVEVRVITRRAGETEVIRLKASSFDSPFFGH